MSSYKVFDIEVDICDFRRRPCQLHVPTDKIIMLQAKEAGQPAKYIYSKDGISRNHPLKLDKDQVLVGHNIKFDLLYFWENPHLKQWLKDGGVIWDTCVAEFFLSGQDKTLKYDLSSVSVLYGGTPKIDFIADCFKAGMLFSEIDKDIAIEYGLKDVVDTELIYLQQIEKAKALGMYKILQSHMNHLLAVCEIEHNGLLLDKNLLATKAEEQAILVDQWHHDLRRYTVERGWPQDLVPFNPQKNDQISAFLFGGDVKYDTTIPNPTANGSLVYTTGAKKGQTRMKKHVGVHVFKGIGLRPTVETKKDGYYKTGNSELKFIDHGFVETLLTYRKEFKLLSTYFLGIHPLISPQSGCLHSSFSLKSTASGRLASHKPNVQNLHPRMLDCFVSRFPNGKLVEMDFSQLEICIAAWIFNDSLMQAEIANSIDLHQENAIKLFARSNISKAERKLAKFLSFGLLYGQGFKTMAALHDIDEDVCAKFINVFYDKYLDIAEAHKQLPNEVKQNAHGDKSYICTPTGRRYTLHKYDTQWGRKFSPTEAKNYKIQGTAADITATAVGNVFRYLQNHRKHAILINEIHDAILLDVAQDCPDEIIQQVKLIMESAGKHLSKTLGRDIGVSLKADMKSGKTWSDAK